MATKAGAKRLGKESQMMDRDPPPYCYARPREDNVLEWHFILRGPPDTPYAGGEYWGQLLFPSDYPFKPPGIKVSTPSGRFHTDTKICTSMSDFHPGSWNPAWSVANILVGLLSFMCADEMTTGSVMVSAQDRKTLAARSHAFNIQQRRFKQLFPEYCGEKIKDLPNMGEQASSSAASQDQSKDISSGAKSNEAKVRSPRVNVPASTDVTTSGPRLSSTITGTAASIKNEQIEQRGKQAAQINQQQEQQLPAAQPHRTRAVIPLIMALFAYLFLSRLMSSSSTSPSATAP